MENVRADILSRKAKLLEVLLRQNKDGLIRYNYLKLIATEKLEKVYKTLKSF